MYEVRLLALSKDAVPTARGKWNFFLEILEDLSEPELHSALLVLEAGCNAPRNRWC